MSNKDDLLWFKLDSIQHITIMRGSEVVGRIFTPSGSGNNCVNAIQVCGLSESFDFWGCMLEGFKDIQLLFDGKSMEDGAIKPTQLNGCNKCFMTPCQCENITPGENPFIVKREHQLKDRIKGLSYRAPNLTKDYPKNEIELAEFYEDADKVHKIKNVDNLLCDIENQVKSKKED